MNNWKKNAVDNEDIYEQKLEWEKLWNNANNFINMSLAEKDKFIDEAIAWKVDEIIIEISKNSNLTEEQKRKIDNYFNKSKDSK